MAKYVYPAIFTAEQNGTYSVLFPDLESCYTSGSALEEALEMAQDVLCLTLYGLEEEGATIAPPSDIHTLQTVPNGIVSLVMADTLEYRKFYDNHAVKKTLTIPSWLNAMAERNEINFSATLQTALKEQLHIAER